MKALLELQWGDTQRLEDHTTVENISGSLVLRKHTPFHFQTALLYSLSSRLMIQSLITQRTDENSSGSAGAKDDVSVDKSLSYNSCCWSYSEANAKHPVTKTEMQRERKRLSKQFQDTLAFSPSQQHQSHLGSPLGHGETTMDGARLLWLGV